MLGNMGREEAEESFFLFCQKKDEKAE